LAEIAAPSDYFFGRRVQIYLLTYFTHTHRHTDGVERKASSHVGSKFISCWRIKVDSPTVFASFLTFVVDRIFFF